MTPAEMPPPEEAVWTLFAFAVSISITFTAMLEVDECPPLSLAARPRIERVWFPSVVMPGKDCS